MRRVGVLRLLSTDGLAPSGSPDFSASSCPPVGWCSLRRSSPMWANGGSRRSIRSARYPLARLSAAAPLPSIRPAGMFSGHADAAFVVAVISRRTCPAATCGSGAVGIKQRHHPASVCTNCPRSSCVNPGSRARIYRSAGRCRAESVPAGRVEGAVNRDHLRSQGLPPGRDGSACVAKVRSGSVTRCSARQILVRPPPAYPNAPMSPAIIAPLRSSRAHPRAAGRRRRH